MQGEYFGFNQTFPYNGFPPFGYSTIGSNIMPSNRIVEKLKKNKHKISDQRKYEELTNSTDESIHLVRSRKTGESAPNRYENEQSLKKRSQSGNSIVKGLASNPHSSQQINRSRSDERSFSPTTNNHHHRESLTRTESGTASNRIKNKKKLEKKIKKGQWQYSSNTNYSDNRIVDPSVYFPPPPAQSYMQPMQQQPAAYPYSSALPYQCQPYPDYSAQLAQSPYCYPDQQFYPYNAWPCQNYDVAPGGPLSAVDYYNQAAAVSQQQQQQPHDPCGQSQYYQSDPTSYQTGPPQYDPYGQQNLASYNDNTQACMQNLPAGAKIVAEYFLGYLDEQPNHQANQAYQSPQPYQQQQYLSSSSTSESSKEDVDIEIWEKKGREERKDSGVEEIKVLKSNSEIVHCGKGGMDDPNELKKLKDDIIDTIQKQFNNMRFNNSEKSDPIQPIFLVQAPKASEASQPKPIYVPRNIYVPVIRPVFVPRERIIVRPQIIHVARPVLVDRPVPIQQRPIVIERDRPVPVRVETIERTEPVMCGGGGDITKNIETSTETTYHEFTQNFSSNGSADANVDYASSSNYNYGDKIEYEENRRKQEFLNILEEAERRKKDLESKSNDVIRSSEISQYKTAKYSESNNDSNVKSLDSMPYNSGYTLEVLDQRVSDKFEKIDQETIKLRYGVDSFQYLPASVEISNNQQQQQQHNRPSSTNYGSSSADYYNNNMSTNLGNSGSFKSLASGNEISNSSSNIYGNYGSNSVVGVDSASAYGTVTNVAQIPSPDHNRGHSQSQTPVAIQNVQKLIQSFGSYPSEQNPASSILTLGNN